METLSVFAVVIHAAPPEEHGRYCKPDLVGGRHGSRLQGRTAQHKTVARVAAAQPRQKGGRGDGASAHRSQQQCKSASTATLHVARQQRQQRKQSNQYRGVEEENPDAQQYPFQEIGLGDVLPTDAHRRAQALAPQGIGFVLTLPAADDDCGPKRQHGIEKEDPRTACTGDHGSSHQGADDARGVHRHPVEGQRSAKPMPLAKVKASNSGGVITPKKRRR